MLSYQSIHDVLIVKKANKIAIRDTNEVTNLWLRIIMRSMDCEAKFVIQLIVSSPL